MSQNITILGSTGSIGKSTLALVQAYPEKYQVFALTGHQQIDVLYEQCVQYQPKYAVMATAALAQTLQQRLKSVNCSTDVLYGEQALCDVASASEVDMVMAAIVGAAGLKPTWAAVLQGKRILLANKETLVVAGSLFMQMAQNKGATILPVDSEHNAIFQSLPKHFSKGLHQCGVESIILTASGGPFLHKPQHEMNFITPEQAVAHPNWRMGQKISVDSATMMNKGLEVIEAHWLFGAKANQIEVIIHPQSVIHSMVRYIDGSVLAQLGTPDMKTPIAYCMAYPERIDSQVEKLDFKKLSELTFIEPDLERFACLKLAFHALDQAEDAPCILNAANEVAVAAFLEKRIAFTDIAHIVASSLDYIDYKASGSIEALLEKDQQTRAFAQAQLKDYKYVS
ncbi:1-deoxy-D-xylulose-5-phosphate reductoisomerase [Neisseria sp. Ec49-e6-T10]|uniref:1-deoxy-D-xylulose-5-phosphate reductoisomerase n=1 Tax=Neisseria sp. Ec49-e6-T10 TaxID=3140744 RepID=UPI003EBA286F